uniref:Uncharacterized protein n=1 Tax=Nothobranchius pienaari TaxID=704102 RepID=A0A1A8MWZ6_9TELE
MFVGTGTRLTVEPKEQHKPEYYILRDKDDSPKLCLATEFTRQNATMDHRLFNDTEPARNPKDHRFFSQVAFLKDGDETSCEERLDAPTCEASLEPDRMVNLATISISILRLIFIKTVVFNVLITLRLWISQ